MGINPRNLIIRPTPGPLSPTSFFCYGLMTIAVITGAYLDCQERNRYTYFRDKSKMFGKPKEEGEPPSWGADYWKVPESIFSYRYR